MFCENCGKQIRDDAKFCKHCGYRMVEDDVVESVTEESDEVTEKLSEKAKKMSVSAPKKAVPAEPKKPVPKGPIIAVIAVILAILVGVTGYSTIGLNGSKDKLAKEIKAADIEEYTKQVEAAEDDWQNLGTFSISGKKAVIGELKSISHTVSTYYEEQVEFYQTIDLSDAEDDVLASYEDCMKQIEKVGKTDYAAYNDLFVKMNEAIYMYIDPECPVDVIVQQIDASEFPKIKLYLSIKDPVTGDVPEDLEQSFFYINKEDANGKFIKQTVSTINQLNEEESLKVDMVADVSGSMMGTPLMEAKQIMSNFVQSVQFSAGDMVELTSFATGVRLEQEFTNDANLLLSDINNLYTGDMTSLYDALYTAVDRVAAQTGARCVIAFTDGNDNYSSCSPDDVINLANRYHIPVFIIGIGNIDYSGASWIAEQTGGAYFGINDVYSMQSIYDQIYRMEKELYLLEYEDASGATISDSANIQVGYRSLKYGGSCTYTYTPNTLINVKSATLYSDGPEAVVEKYMKNFDDAMNSSDFSYISDCLLPGSPIYQEQQAYVQKSISEQLDSYEIVSTDYTDTNNCVVTTRETYYVQVKNQPLQLMTQQCMYQVTNTNGEWKMTAFAGPVNVLYRINQ